MVLAAWLLAGVLAPEAERLVHVLRDGSGAEIDAAVYRLADMGEEAIPALTRCLQDPEVRSGCADILARMPARLAVTPLKDAIEHAPKVSTREQHWRGMLIAALGRLCSRDTVPYLEELYRREKDDERIASSIRWALWNLADIDLGYAHNPWEGCAYPPRGRTCP